VAGPVRDVTNASAGCPGVAVAWQDGRVPLILRSATVADVGELLGLWLEAAENATRAPDTREAVTALLGRDPDAVIVAEQDGELVGSVIAGWDGWRCHLYRLAVRPAWRRRGVGSALLLAAEDRFRAVGAARADAMVLDGNDLGQSLWRASGYRRQDDWRRWVKGLR
jgi:ribosomal protein S18 acetylase RimI-like enzyme